MMDVNEAMNPTTDEAIKYLEGIIFTHDFIPSTLRAVAVNGMAIEAFREQNRRVPDTVRCGECAWCKAEYTIIDDDFGQPIHPRMIKFCWNCGRKLESEGKSDG